MNTNCGDVSTPVCQHEPRHICVHAMLETLCKVFLVDPSLPMPPAPSERAQRAHYVLKNAHRLEVLSEKQHEFREQALCPLIKGNL